MTRSQAKAALLAAFPKKSFVLTIADWHNYHGFCDTGEDRLEYKVSVIPGPNGEMCKGTDAHATLEAALQEALSWANSDKTPDAKADADFAEEPPLPLPSEPIVFEQPGITTIMPACKIPGCSNPAWPGGLCQEHSLSETPVP